MKARDIMSRPVISIGRDITVTDAIMLLTEHGFAAAPVIDELGQVVGIVSEPDAMRATMTHTDGGDHRDDPVSTVMTTPAEVIGPGTDSTTVAERMLAGRLRCLPVVAEGLLIGFGRPP